MTEIIKEAFELQDWIVGTLSGGIDPPRILIDIVQHDDKEILVTWQYPEICGLSDRIYHNSDRKIYTDVFRIEENLITMNGNKEVFNTSSSFMKKEITEKVRQFYEKYNLVYEGGTNEKNNY